MVSSFLLPTSRPVRNVCQTRNVTSVAVVFMVSIFQHCPNLSTQVYTDCSRGRRSIENQDPPCAMRLYGRSRASGAKPSTCLRPRGTLCSRFAFIRAESDARTVSSSAATPPAADDEPLDPASRSARLDEQVQAVPIRVASWRCGTDEGGRERLVGMASSALGSAGFRGGFGYNIHSPIICGNGLDFATRRDPLSLPMRVINYYSSVTYRATRTAMDPAGNPLVTQAGRRR